MRPTPAELLDGYVTTRHGWVQSYGSRCTRPSILCGVSRQRPMTVSWTAYAQGLTTRPVKGMLTGPVTMRAWSFVRTYQPLARTADQVALALRDEVVESGRRPDRPGRRAGAARAAPLRAEDRAECLRWSVGAFRLATSAVADATQIHTHLCYSEFGEERLWVNPDCGLKTWQYDEVRASLRLVVRRWRWTGRLHGPARRRGSSAPARSIGKKRNWSL